MNAIPLISFVGAGPGDPDLLTVRALKVLQAADIVLYDALVGDGVLDLISRGAQCIAVGKRAGGRSIAQSEINSMLVRLARPGRRLVRLKGGDPAIFGRLAEEISAAEDAGLSYEIIPGITAASAAAAASGIGLTKRGVARRVQFVTAHAQAGEDLQLDWPSLADKQATTVFYMARQSAPAIAERLMEHGLAADTPVLLMSDVSAPSEMRMRVVLSDVAEAVTKFPPGAPLVVLVGEAVADSHAKANVRSPAVAMCRSSA